MTQPTHTHKTQGGRYVQTGEQMGGGALAGHLLIFYHDLNKDIASITTEADWRENWRSIAPDDCPVCLGSGHDHIKGNKDRPCGHCYGLGKVRDDGETPADLWELATVATGIIQRQQKELEELRQIANCPEVQAFIEQQRQQAISDAMGRQEQEWRDGTGHGPGGRRYTGD